MVLNLARIRLRSALLWVLGVLLCGVAATLALVRISDRLLVHSAERTAVSHAAYLRRSTPQLDALLRRGELTTAAREHLERSHGLGDAVRFRIYDAQGRQLLVSDDLRPASPPRRERADASAVGAGDARAGDAVLGGASHVELRHGRGEPDRPALYAEARVPLPGDGGPAGAVEVEVDLTAAARQIHTALLLVGLAVGSLVVVLGGALAIQMWRRGAERRRMDERVRYLARHDALSGALNRASFEEALQHAARRCSEGGPGFAVLCIDLDRFKDVNDTLGHAAGDDVLRQATERLRGLSRQGDVLARLGGDEFAILQSAVGGPSDMAQFGHRVVEVLRPPYEVMSHLVSCPGSVGAARFVRDASSVADLLHRADIAMYRAKTGGGGFSFYDSALDAQLQARRQLVHDLKEGGMRGGFDLHYQPIHRSGDRALVGYEALMRWKHPSRGMLMPSEFIPLAEECRVIDVIGEWALREACAEAARWPSPLTVSVNLSSAQFRGPRPLFDVVGSALSDSGLAPQRLVVEITESLLMANTDQVLRTINALAALGVQIAMDDFGTGYSSLAYLWRFPFNKIKIDRAFLQGLGQDARVALIIRSIVVLAHSMGLRVNAEGVETVEQRELLEALGCDELQGFLLGAPTSSKLLVHGCWATEPAPLPRPPELASLQTAPLPL